MDQQLLNEVKEYFNMNAFTWHNRKKISDIMRFIPASHRKIRKAIEAIRNKTFMIAADLISGGYFLVDRHNKHDVLKAEEYAKSQKSKIFNTWNCIMQFDDLFPIGQMHFEDNK